MSADLARLGTDLGLVVFGSLMSSVGWLFRRSESRASTRGAQDASQDVRLALLQQSVSRIEVSQTAHSAQLGNLNAEVSTVAALFARHEDWHKEQIDKVG